MNHTLPPHSNIVCLFREGRGTEAKRNESGRVAFADILRWTRKALVGIRGSPSCRNHKVKGAAVLLMLTEASLGLYLRGGEEGKGTLRSIVSDYYWIIILAHWTLFIDIFLRQAPALSSKLECSGVITAYCNLQPLDSSNPSTSASE